jgi:hypothetical protein
MQENQENLDVQNKTEFNSSLINSFIMVAAGLGYTGLYSGYNLKKSSLWFIETSRD